MKSEVAEAPSAGEAGGTGETADESTATPAVVDVPALTRNAKYETSTKALRRWADERLKLADQPDGSVVAAFRYEGTTCRNMGRTMLFDYVVRLGPAAERYPIREQHCGPAPGDDGHTYMCRYMSNAEHLMVAIDHEKPLLGRPLDDVLTWQRPASPAGCYCEPSSRKHKWGLVLETIHYALVRREQSRQPVPVQPVQTQPLQPAAPAPDPQPAAIPRAPALVVLR